MFAQPYQFRFIYRGENPSRAYRVRPAASVLPQTFRRVAGKELLKFSRKSHGKTMQKRGALLKERRFRPPSLLDVYSNQTRRAFPRHESACPAVARDKKIARNAKAFAASRQKISSTEFPDSIVPFPRRRLTGHEIDIKWCWPAENAVTRCEGSLIARRRRSSKRFASILGGGRSGPKAKTFPLVAKAS